MSKSTGGPAFPVSTIDGFTEDGMTLRDWFAGQALNGMLAHSTRYKPRAGAKGGWHDAISEEAFGIADAMIAERDKP